jgi:hypothetical protein
MKNRKTVTMLSVLDDRRNVTPFVILKRETSKKKKNSYWNYIKMLRERMEELVVEWLKEIWHKSPGVFLKKGGMLVSGAFKGSLREKVKAVASNLLNTDLLIISRGITSQLQVLDVLVNRPFKD